MRLTKIGIKFASLLSPMQKPQRLPKTTLLVSLTLFACLLIGCENMDDRTTKNTGMGAATGAVIGGVIGHQSGDTAEGAAIGATVGGASGYGYSKATEDEDDNED